MPTVQLEKPAVKSSEDVPYRGLHVGQLLSQNDDPRCRPDYAQVVFQNQTKEEQETLDACVSLWQSP